MQYSTILKSSPSLRLAHLSSDHCPPPLPVNFLLGAGGPCHWPFGHCNLTIDCIGCSECRLLLLSLLYRIDFAVGFRLLRNIDLIPCWLDFKMSSLHGFKVLQIVYSTPFILLMYGPTDNFHGLKGLVKFSCALLISSLISSFTPILIVFLSCFLSCTSLIK